ncbi:MAG: MmcQ/YjbR family DNA-binding protein [Bacteroidales bacterium]|jgi:predicted DNA-binding protein (MmcQ/YjbR family)|nr:MmcQ/YjbR family DNA-binding protein [Bacteroidales bacterium]
MNIEELRDFCMSVKGAEESFPFGDDTLVFKVMGKMFAYVGLERHNGDLLLNMKCDPQRSIWLREHFEYVKKPVHAGDTYQWNSICFEKMDDELLKELIIHSRDEVIKKLSKKKQQEYRNE